MAASARSIPSRTAVVSATRDTVGSPSPDAVASAMPALSSTASRTGPVAPASRSRATWALWAASPPRRLSTGWWSRPTSVGSRVELGDRAVAHPPHRRGRGEGELVEAVVTAEDGCRAAAAREDPGDERGDPGVGHPDGGVGGLRRVGQRAERVERGADPEVAAGHRGVAHRGVEGVGEAERDAGRARRPRPPAAGVRVSDDAQRLEHVGRPGARRGRAVAVLDHPQPGRRHDDGGHRRDVDRVQPVTAGADDVDGRARAPRCGWRARA